VVASIEIPDGSRYMVIQNYDSWSEPYGVKLFSRIPGEEWRSSYLAHESGSWRDASLNYDACSKRLTVTNSGVGCSAIDRAKTPVIGMPDHPPFSFRDS
jgi:hypothetical protein